MEEDEVARATADRPGDLLPDQGGGAVRVRDRAPDPVRELRLGGGHGGGGLRPHEQVLGGLRGQALLRGPAVHRPAGEARDRAGEDPLRRRSRERPALLGLARRTWPSTTPCWSRATPSWASPAPRRPPHPRLGGELLRPLLPVRPVRRGPQDAPHRLRRRARAGAARAAPDHRLRGARPTRGSSTSRPSARSPTRWAPTSSPTSPTSPASSWRGSTPTRSPTPTSSPRPPTRRCADRAAP